MRVSQYFNLGFGQGQVDFVDVPVDRAETLTASIELSPSVDFKRLRKQVRDPLVEADLLPKLDEATVELFRGSPSP